MLLISRYQNLQRERRHTSERTTSTRDELYTSQLMMFWEDKCHNCRDNQCINSFSGVLFHLIGGCGFLITCGMYYFNLQRKVMWEEYLECEMILLIDIFIRANKIYGNVLLVNTLSTQCHADMIATIRGEMCTSRTYNRFK